ncbi:MAG: GNAT family N-acetyltransferase [Bacillota bacterium]|nr:GNAT family N-acetyltransferase [Bacillota bacterium]
MKHQFVICTDRCRLRQVQPDDLSQVLSWRNDDRIKKWFVNRSTISPQQQIIWYNNYLNNDNDMIFIIEEKSNTGSPIGLISLYNINPESNTAEFGRFMIGDFNYRGKGLGFECANAVCAFGFGELGLREIHLDVFEDNTSAVGVYKKIGFTITGKRLIDNKALLTMVLEYKSEIAES